MTAIQKIFFFWVFLIPCIAVSQCENTIVTVTTETANYGPEMGWQIVNANNIVLFSFSADEDFENYSSEVCLEDGCYIFTATDTYGDGWNGGTASINVNGNSIPIALPDGSEGQTPFGVNAEGCTLNPECTNTEVSITTQTQAYGAEVSWEIRDQEGQIQYAFAATEDNSTYTDSACLTDGCYVFVAMDSYGDGWNGGWVEITINGDSFEYNLPDGSQDAIALGVNEVGCEVIVPGCTNPDALNFDPAATSDDGSCQTIQDYLETQSITPLIQSGPIHNRVNWGIQNRGVANPNDEFQTEAAFVQMLQDSLIGCFTIGHPLEKEPYARYRDFFNIDAWWWENAPEEGNGWSWDILKGLRDAYYLPWQDDEHGWATLFSTTQYGGGGGAGVQPETRTGDGLMFGVGFETLLHEFGHTMPQVPDEYTASGEWSGGQCWESANTTGFVIRDSIPWRNWIDPDTPLPTPYTAEYENTIGAFEGALTNYFGCHRPTAKGCYMGAGGFGPGFGLDFCNPCRQRTVCLLYRYVDVIENPIPADPNVEINGATTLTFSADIVKPEPNTQTYTWTLNGMVVAQGTEEVEIEFGLCDNYELTLVVEDTTSWVRYDEAFDHIYPKPMETHTWFIDQTAVTDYDLTVETNAINLSCNGNQDGIVNLSAEGGTAPYEGFYEGISVGLQHNNLSVGEYTYWITDANGCGVVSTATVNQDPLLDVSICTDYSDEWIAEASVMNYDPNDLNFEWSNGTSGQQSSGFGQGDHQLTVTTSEGCSVEIPFELGPNPDAISVSETLINSAGDDPTGAIYLSISGGNTPYMIDWYDKLARDLTNGNPDASDASGTNFGHLPEMAFDDDVDTKWLEMGSNNVWLTFTFDQQETISHYSITSGDDEEDRDPQDWELQAQINGNDWLTLDTRTGIDFEERRQRKLYGIDSPGAYSVYRLLILNNSGSDATQLQEIELIGASADDPFIYNAEVQNQVSRVGIAPGDYRYEVRDQYSQCAINANSIGYGDPFNVSIDVIQESSCSVQIDGPNASFSYYWLADAEATEILHIGNSFIPSGPGNYWVAAVQNSTGLMSDYRPGFAITMPEQPVIEETSEGTLEVTNASPDLIYRWYDMSCGGTLIHEGNTYSPGNESVQLYVGSWWANPFPDPIDPTNVPGLVSRMDAADIDGNGNIDNPSLPTGSMYTWNFEPGSEISNGGWFAYRGNYQNGLGIADFATMWLQCAEEGFNNYQTVIMAYEENPITWEGSAPFFGLDDMIPYSAAPTQQLYANDVPASTLAGITVLNGGVVDPMTTANPLQFCVLAQTFTENGGWVDCTDTHWEGKVGELLFYESQLSEENLIGISEFLRKKWISKADLESIRTFVDWDGQSIGIEALDQNEVFVVYPNPSNGECLVQIGQDQTITQWNIFSSKGALVAQESGRNHTGILNLSQHTRDLPSGIYYINLINSQEQSQTARYVKF